MAKDTLPLLGISAFLGYLPSWDIGLSLQELPIVQGLGHLGPKAPPSLRKDGFHAWEGCQIGPKVPAVANFCPIFPSFAIISKKGKVPTAY
jgi:hypothetical protein